MQQTKTISPWWLILLLAGTDIIDKVVSGNFSGDGKNRQSRQKGINVIHGEGIRAGIKANLITATTVIGERVIGSDGKKLGKIEEVAMDLTTGTVSYFVLSAGGILGVGDKFYAIPLNALTLNPEEKTFYMEVDKKRLKQMPQIDKHNWPERPE